MAGKKLGQHFLLDPVILRKIVDAANIGPDDTVVEIGPGLGRMTAVLAGAAGRVIAIEIDEDLYEKARERVQEYDNVQLILGDALAYPYEELGPFKVVANIPYYITTPILFRLLDARPSLRSMTLTVQKEVGLRIVAGPGSKTYGVLSVAVQYRGKAELKFVIPAGSFRPVPEVDSAVIRIDLLSEPPVRVTDERHFFRVVRAAFSQRRKTLANALKPLFGDVRTVLQDAGVDPMRRAETLSIGEFAKIAAALRKE
jgi:16S rRNA (adenine1518-N6/adenine1519-N6)-dimethyltransferase